MALEVTLQDALESMSTDVVLSGRQGVITGQIRFES